MFLKYEKPFVEIIDFVALEQLATAQDERSARDAGDDSITIGSMPGFSEGVEDWG